jgi:hypothetical protein
MTISDTIKNNPWKIIAGSSGSIIAIVTALFTLDARYAHAADVEKDKIIIQRTVKESTSMLRQQLLEDKLFELDIKRAQPVGLTPVDSALRERYQRQLRELTQKKEQ